MTTTMSNKKHVQAKISWDLFKATTAGCINPVPRSFIRCSMRTKAHFAMYCPVQIGLSAFNGETQDLIDSFYLQVGRMGLARDEFHRLLCGHLKISAEIPTTADDVPVIVAAIVGFARRKMDADAILAELKTIPMTDVGA